MLFSSRTVSLFLAALVAAGTTGLFSLMQTLDFQILVLFFAVIFSVSFLLTYISLEFLIFREINKIYTLLEKIKKKDLRLNWKNYQGNMNPLQKLNQEIFSLATKKQQEIDELKRLEVFRREFLADVSHELKTPIFAAQGFVHTLLDGAMNDKAVREKFLKKAARSLDGLEKLVSDLLTLSQMETGQIRMQSVPIDLVALVREEIDQLEEFAQKKKTEVRLELKDYKNFIAVADKQRIGQVIKNLVENAIKYGGELNKVSVVLGQDKDHIHISVQDEGPGIPSEHLSRIFERFYRIEKSRAKGNEGGTGLGLAIVKHICEAHNSRVTVTSKPGKGATFYFKLDRYKESKSKTPVKAP